VATSHGPSPHAPGSDACRILTRTRKRFFALHVKRTGHGLRTSSFLSDDINLTVDALEIRDGVGYSRATLDVVRLEGRRGTGAARPPVRKVPL
jgi:hypothetical protein